GIEYPDDGSDPRRLNCATTFQHGVVGDLRRGRAGACRRWDIWRDELFGGPADTRDWNSHGARSTDHGCAETRARIRHEARDHWYRNRPDCGFCVNSRDVDTIVWRHRD